MSLGYELLDYQIPHVENILQAFTVTHGVIDTSTTGNGKTYTTTFISNHLNLPMIVLCPAILVTHWTRMREFGANIICAASYDSIRGSKSKDTTNGTTIKASFPYIARIDSEEGLSYAITQEYINLVQQGFLLVIDESSKVKNKNTAITKAVGTLIRGITERATYSRFIMLSATPYDKAEHLPILIRTMGYSKHESLSSYDLVTRLHDPSGLLDVVKICKRLDKPTTLEILSEYPTIDNYTKLTMAKKIAGELFHRVIKKRVVYAMSRPSSGHLGTLYGNMSSLEYERYKICIHNLQELLLFNDESSEVEVTESVIAKLTLILRDLEHSKVGIFAREVINVLNKNPNSKVIVNFNYKSTIPMFLQRLHNIRPHIIDGDTKMHHRTQIIDQFQEPNTLCRLLVATIATGSMGISLHDLNGNFPRYTFMSPSYSIQNLHQAAGRTIRAGAKSNSTVYMIYGKQADQTVEEVSAKEQRIMDALSKKNKVMKDILEQAVKDGIKFPGEYPVVASEPDLSLLDLEEKYESDIGINTIYSEDIKKIKAGTHGYMPRSGDVKAEILRLHK